MNNNGTTVVPPNSTGNAIDCSSLSSGGVTVYRQRVVLADNTHSANFATVSAGSLQVIVENASLVVSGQVSVTGSVVVSTLGAGTNHIGEVNISLMPQVSVLNVAGTAHIGEVNISLMPAVALAAGTQHVGEVNISLMPAVVVTSITNAINVSAMPNVTLAAANNTVGAVTVAGFIDPSGNQRNVVDSVNTALRVNVVAGGAGGGIATGPVAVGASVTAGNNPVLMGGVDGSSFARNLRVDATGGLIISNISATVNVAGSFTVGGQTGGTSVTAASTYTLVGGMDGSIGRVALTDANGHFVITGTVALAGGTNNIGTINNISAGVVLAAGAANIGTINNISAAVVLAAGTANIGTLNNISAAVALAAGTAHIGEVNISLMPQVSVLNVAGTAHMGEVNISLMPAVVLAAGTNNIGTVQAISATVNVNIAAQSSGLALRMGGRVKTSASSTAADSTTNPFWVDKNGRLVVTVNHPALAPSASHGPKTVQLSGSASVALIAAQGSGLVTYVDSLLVTNGGPSLVQLIMYEAAATASPVVAQWLAANGGGFSHQFNPPWRVSANTALNIRVKPSFSTNSVCVTAQFHTGVD